MSYPTSSLRRDLLGLPKPCTTPDLAWGVISAVPAQAAKAVQCSLEYTTLRKVTQATEIYYDPNIEVWRWVLHRPCSILRSLLFRCWVQGLCYCFLGDAQLNMARSTGFIMSTRLEGTCFIVLPYFIHISALRTLSLCIL